jgi:hypothetical protein
LISDVPLEFVSGASEGVNAAIAAATDAAVGVAPEEVIFTTMLPAFGDWPE